METIEATFKVVTPMFMSGANQSHAELRLASIKGALRFWWRALAWGRLNGDVAEIRRQENELFGSTATGQAGVLMKLSVDDTSTTQPQFANYPGAIYLGYGVMDFKGQLTRPCIPPPLQFKVTLRFKKGISHKQIESVHGALVALGTLGALGSKARKGYGSVVLHEIKSLIPIAIPRNTAELKKTLADLLRQSQQIDSPPYTAISKATSVSVFPSALDPLTLLDKIGRAMQLYRSWGRNGKVNGEDALRNFPDDHHDMHKAAGGGSVNRHPERAMFGLPHNYYFSSTKSKVDVGPASKKLERRASPLLIHIHTFPNHTQAAVLSIIPAEFLPKDEKILIKTRAGNQQVDLNVDYTVISDFISPNYFPELETVQI